jgi:hypothetical protein
VQEFENIHEMVICMVDLQITEKPSPKMVVAEDEIQMAII